VKTLLLAVLAPTLAFSARAQTESGRSPFLPPNVSGAAGAAQDPGENFELAGATSSADGSAVCVYDRATKHSRWIPVGESDGDLQVLSYDGNADQAVVRFDGRTHVLSLRQARTAAAGPASFGPLPPAGSSLAANQPVVDPSTVGKSPEVLKQERDARMLVSDLLEISIQQRKAYQEAQRRAAAAKHNGATPTTP
jgi:hypothetical protein